MKAVLFGFILLMISDSFAQICLKLAANSAEPLEFSFIWLVRVFSHIWVYGAIIGYICAFINWMTILKKIPIGLSFAASHLEVVTVMIVSYWVFNEPFTLCNVIGGFCIIFGIAILGVAEEKKI